jgi:SpoIIAA-like
VIELIEGLPDAVVGIEAVGTVTAEDYRRVAVPAIERAGKRHGKISLMHVIGDRFADQTGGAVWEDAKVGLAHARSFERVAVVTDLASVRALVKTAGWSLPGEMRLFSNAERAEAKSWVSAGPNEERG